jgi:hypothetical protein
MTDPPGSLIGSDSDLHWAGMSAVPKVCGSPYLLVCFFSTERKRDRHGLSVKQVPAAGAPQRNAWQVPTAQASGGVSAAEIDSIVNDTVAKIRG